MKSFVLLLPMIVLGACGTPNPSCAGLPGGQYCLQASTAATSVSVRQKVDARFAGHREAMIADIEADAAGMQFVALTPFGQKVLHIAYDNKAASALLLPNPRLDATQLLALLQIALWPADTVRQGLQDLTLEETPMGRRVMADGKVVIDVSHDASPRPYRHLRIVMPAIDAALEMETLADVPEGAQ